MGNFRSIEEVERMASIVSDMEKSKLIGKSGPYMENANHEAYLKIISKRNSMLARRNGKNTNYIEQIARINAAYMMDESTRAFYFVKSNLESICQLFGLDINGDVLVIGDRKYFIHLLRGTVVEIK